MTTHLPTIVSSQDLRAVVERVGDTAAGRAHAISGAIRLDLTRELPTNWAMGVGRDFAAGEVDWSGSCWINCPDCGRRSLGAGSFSEHAEKVHTFSDMQSLVGQELRDKYGRNGTATLSGIYVWVEDMTDDWVVYQVDGGDTSGLYQVTYSIDESDNVTFGDPVEVVRRTVYDPVKDAS